MKIKKSLLVVILYVTAILTSYGIFNAFICYAEDNAENSFDTCAYDSVHPVKASVAPAPTTYNTYLEAYFENLTENFGYNYKGSCG